MNNLEFGTAGIRGIIGDADYELNKYNVYQVIDSFVKYLKNKYQDTIKIVIGRDNRNQSKEFSDIALAILSQNGIEVIYNKEIAPTPFISYLIMKHNAQGGINITASHNPKEYNGIKLYNDKASQMLPNEIEDLKKYFNNISYYKNEFNFNDSIKQKFIHEVTEDEVNSYINNVSNIASKTGFKNISIAFSPLHGNGAQFVKKLYTKNNIKAFYVEKEMIEDKNFTHVADPNPENVKAYTNVLKLAIEKNTDLALVTDPDSDRVGALIKHEGEYVFTTGNELATIIFNYLLETRNYENSYLVFSFVSSSLPKKMAELNNVKTIECETGFKWIAHEIEQEPNMNMLFSFEESYGSLLNSNIARDKDAIQSCLIIPEMASYYKDKNKTLIDVLNEIYEKYGFVESKSISVNIKNKTDLELLKSKFKTIKIDNSKFIDFSSGIEKIKTDMYKIAFDEYSWVALRPSGTEPKAKFYIFIIDKNKDEAKKKFDYLTQELDKII